MEFPLKDTKPFDIILYSSHLRKSILSRTASFFLYHFVSFVFVSSLGQSVEFRTIWGLEISNKPAEAEPSEPKIRFVAGIHGNAPVGTEMLLEFAALLCINYGKNPAITRVSVGGFGNIVW